MKEDRPTFTTAVTTYTSKLHQDSAEPANLDKRLDLFWKVCIAYVNFGRVPLYPKHTTD